MEYKCRQNPEHTCTYLPDQLSKPSHSDHRYDNGIHCLNKCWRLYMATLVQLLSTEPHTLPYTLPEGPSTHSLGQSAIPPPSPFQLATFTSDYVSCESCQCVKTQFPSSPNGRARREREGAREGDWEIYIQSVGTGTKMCGTVVSGYTGVVSGLTGGAQGQWEAGPRCPCCPAWEPGSKAWERNSRNALGQALDKFSGPQLVPWESLHSREGEGERMTGSGESLSFSGYGLAGLDELSHTLYGLH